MVSTMSWSTYADVDTLVNVGSEAICIQWDNILLFSDLKTNHISYYKAESPQLGLSISCMAGHNRFALVAFSEGVLRPSVHIIEYPKFTKYAVFATNNIFHFVDICFNEYDLVFAISGKPSYTMCIWNFRTGQLVVQHDTGEPTLSRSLACTVQHIPQIAQFCSSKQQLLIWELCSSATGVDMHEVSKIRLQQKFALSSIFSVCYTEDNHLYAVDNLGEVFLVEIAQFQMKSLWSIIDPHEKRTKFRSFKIANHRQGLIAYCSDSIYYLRRKVNRLICAWKLFNNQLPPGGLYKCLTNGNGEVYCAAELGNLYHMEILSDNVSFNAVHANNEHTLDFVILKGIKEECIVQLTTKCALKAVDMGRYILYSLYEIPNANAIFAHNVSPCIMVGTTTGILHFIDYSDIRQPVEVCNMETELRYPIISVQFMDVLGVYRTAYNHFFLVKTDYTREHCYEVALIERLDENVGICQYFLADPNFILIFVNQNTDLLLPHTNEMWCFQWLPDESKIKRWNYQLPVIYRDVSGAIENHKTVIEIYALRLQSNIIDCLQLKKDAFELRLMHRIQTGHLASTTGIVGTRNLLTWGIDGTYLHFRSHRKSTKIYGICQVLQMKYRPKVVKKVLACFNAKYVVYLYAMGGVKLMKCATSGLITFENHYITDDDTFVLEPSLTSSVRIEKITAEEIVVHSAEELEARDKLLLKVQDLQAEVTALINYDMSVTGKSQGIFRKFCLNHDWLEQLVAESQKLCEAERRSLEAAIHDQARIRDWLYYTIMSTNSGITYKIRAIFSNFSLENYGLRKRNDIFSQIYDLYRFQDMVMDDDEEAEEDVEAEEGAKAEAVVKAINYFKIEGPSAYDHIMSDALAMQDINIVTANQMYNQDAKYRILLTDRLKYDFNKKFDEVRKIKSELMEAIISTNTTLTKIYDNMNCMLRLLDRPQFKPAELSVPEWQKDEFVKSIMEVDDSEIKAINRRKKKAEVKAAKRGRLLLWAVEFWVKALITMMDGVLEKLWEEEIKKDIPIPEFMLKKEPAEYTLEDQRALKEYEEKCRLLQEDRKKYLGILTDNEAKTNELKTNYILKLNEQVTEMMILKLKYDFAEKHVRLRNLNTKTMYFKKLQWLNRIEFLRADIDLIGTYIQKYVKLAEFWSNSAEDVRLKLDALVVREKAIERQFKGQFLNSIPQHFTPEMIKLFKRRPKTAPKLLNSTLICKELSMRIGSKMQPKYAFPLPKDVFEYLDTLNALDDYSNSPVSLEPRHWDQFVKLRRLKVEIELKVRAANLQLADLTSDMNLYSKEVINLKNTKVDATRKIQEAHDEYLKSVQNQTLVLRLTMGQVELNFMGSLKNLTGCVLMHEDDINDINALILQAGQKKLKAMHRVAYFRRQVIFKEWEHKVVSANIEYLKYMLYIISKCKVSIEFLNLLRNWKKALVDKQKMLNTEGLLEKVSEEKLISFRRMVIRLNEKISEVRQKLDEMKLSNKRIDRKIEDLKVAVAFANTKRDVMIEDMRRREQQEKMEKIKKHTNLIETVRRDYVHIMELKTLLELQRLRTYPTLGPNLSQCLL